jgi:hypothetical protein
VGACILTLCKCHVKYVFAYAVGRVYLPYDIGAFSDYIRILPILFAHGVFRQISIQHSQNYSGEMFSAAQIILFAENVSGQLRLWIVPFWPVQSSTAFDGQLTTGKSVPFGDII